MAVKKRKKTAKKSKLGKKQSLLIITAITLAAAICITVFSLNNRHIADVYDFGKDVAGGIDVSEHNGKIDWQELKGSVDFVLIRAGYRGYGSGKLVEDKYVKENIRGAKKADIPFGLYIYSQAVDRKEAEEEAGFLLRYARRYHAQLPLFIDFEYAEDANGNQTGRLAEAGLSAEENTDIIRAFCDKVQNKGYISGLYASSSVAKNRINLNKIEKNSVIWIADYNDSVTHNVSYDIWQYSCTGKMYGVKSKNVDLNYWYSKRR